MRDTDGVWRKRPKADYGIESKDLERRPTGRNFGWAFAICLFSILTERIFAAQPTPSVGQLNTGTSGDLFESGVIPHLRISINQSELAELNQNFRDYVRADVMDDTGLYREVGIHLKGGAGSFRGVDEKPGLTLKFDQFQQGQTFRGLVKIHLNNSVQDPTYTTEVLCARLFKGAGVPAMRATHARVTLNGRMLGLYVLKEGFDKTFLGKHFKNPDGSRFDPGVHREITDMMTELSPGHPAAAPLERLARSAQEPDPVSRLTQLRRDLDLDRFISFMAVEVMTDHWDGYTLKPNNYRMYHDVATGHMVFLPHGMDQMFSNPEAPLFPYFRGLVAHAVITTEEGRQRYRRRVATLLTNVFKVDVLTNQLEEFRARLTPVLREISAEAGAQHQAAVQQLRSRIIQRVENLQMQISRPDPEPLAFDAAGFAQLSGDGWAPQTHWGAAHLDRVAGNNVQAFHIRVSELGQCNASWRSRAWLRRGKYRFEARARTAALVSFDDVKGIGAGIRIANSAKPRVNKMVGDSPWTNMTYEFEIGDLAEVELVCELRGYSGEVWFDLASLRLVAIK